MPIPLGVLAVAGAGAGPVAAGNAYEWLETQILTSTTTSITFSNLNSSYGSTYQHLQFRITARTTANTDRAVFYARLNSDEANNYSRHVMFSADEANDVLSAGNANVNYLELPPVVGAVADANVFSAMIFDLLDPFETTKYKTSRGIGGYMSSTSNYNNKVIFTSSSWRNTDAVTSVKFDSPVNNNLAIGTRISLYGLRSA